MDKVVDEVVEEEEEEEEEEFELDETFPSWAVPLISFDLTISCLASLVLVPGLVRLIFILRPLSTVAECSTAILPGFPALALLLTPPIGCLPAAEDPKEEWLPVVVLLLLLLLLLLLFDDDDDDDDDDDEDNDKDDEEDDDDVEEEVDNSDCPVAEEEGKAPLEDELRPLEF